MRILHLKNVILKIKYLIKTLQFFLTLPVDLLKISFEKNTSIDAQIVLLRNYVIGFIIFFDNNFMKLHV